MEKLLYIHGYKGSPNGRTASCVRNYFSGCEVIAPQLELEHFDKTLGILKEIVTKDKPDIIIAHSLGTFYSFCLDCKGIFKIVINPCMLPSVEIPKIADDDAEAEIFIEMFQKIEETTYSKISAENAQSYFGIFTNSDELFSYKDLFVKLYGTERDGITNSISVDGEHRINMAAFEKGVSQALAFNNVSFAHRKIANT